MKIDETKIRATHRRGKPIEALATRAPELAAAALLYIAQDIDRLERFLSLTGLDPAQLRASASQPSFLAAVMEYIGGDEALLLAFARDLPVAPEEVARAIAFYGGAP